MSADYNFEETNARIAAALLELRDVPNLIIEVSEIEEYARAEGGFADIWYGKLRDGTQVALKVARMTYQAPRLYKMVAREVYVWSQLKHPNILPFLGLNFQRNTRPLALVSPWMMYGDIRGYLTTYPDADRINLIRGVGHGLSYLHERGITHGDVKGGNILIDCYGEPLLADFGLSFIKDNLEEDGHGQTTSTAFAGSVRWKAPECFDPERFGLTARTSRQPPSDIYSLGMTIYEIISGQFPFQGINDFRVSTLILQGSRPEHPGELAAKRGLHATLWSFVQQSWESEPTNRPCIKELETALHLPVLYVGCSEVTRGKVTYLEWNPASPNVLEAAVHRVLWNSAAVELWNLSPDNTLEGRRVIYSESGVEWGLPNPKLAWNPSGTLLAIAASFALNLFTTLGDLYQIFADDLRATTASFRELPWLQIQWLQWSQSGQRIFWVNIVGDIRSCTPNGGDILTIHGYHPNYCLPEHDNSYDL